MSSSSDLPPNVIARISQKSQGNPQNWKMRVMTVQGDEQGEDLPQNVIARFIRLPACPTVGRGNLESDLIYEKKPILRSPG